MNKFETISKNEDYSKMEEKIVMNATDRKEFIDSVNAADTKIEAIKQVRILLRQFFPEALEIPTKEKESKRVGTRADYRIARNIVELIKIDW
ncbi:MAG: hypothetical protein A2Y82_03290 [Candidatus Buchananbacteria bacterium RBG_13_36_9]|uniref:Uncharacterized protein n=1 Tax=Candidatus Buchananbacteria bacterium RBG_13_36_9 TaxID=1797530 RepID=A0A1G1XPY3_9BACT|nr:MAG: hypothetical protein A2Y82_03290 [Candidatus Buchananbacteria bacterium RBG_13_36_9]